MGYAHHPQIFTHEWFQLHPDLLAALKKYGPALGWGAVLACAGLFVWTIYSAMEMPPMDADAISAAAEEIFVPTGITGYLPPQY